MIFLFCHLVADILMVLFSLFKQNNFIYYFFLFELQVITALMLQQRPRQLWELWADHVTPVTTAQVDQVLLYSATQEPFAKHQC
jgi:hypothetical protein